MNFVKTRNVINKFILLDYEKSMGLLLNKLGVNLRAERVYISDLDKETIIDDFIWENDSEKKIDEE